MTPPTFQTGGALRPGAVYGPRRADSELLEALWAGSCCHVLGPRQIGKSSLRLRVAAALEARGGRTATVDLSGLGVRGEVEAWIDAVGEEIAAELGVEPPRGGARELVRWIGDALPKLGRVFLLFDEVDALVGHPAVADALLGALRAAWDRGAGHRPEDRPTYALFGVAAPFELGADERRTPFNVSRPVALDDFTRAELEPLGAGLVEREALDRVWEWTGGHPYLSHRLCERLAAEPGRAVGTMVEELFLRAGARSDSNLAGVARALAAEGMAEALALYAALLAEGPSPADPRRSATWRLLLAGAAAWRDVAGERRLAVRNEIYARTLDRAWVRTIQEERPFKDAFREWQSAGEADAWLLRGGPLAAATAWAERRVDLGNDEVRFLLRSTEGARAEEALAREAERGRVAAAEARTEAQYQRVRARTALTAAVVLVAGTAVGAALLEAARSARRAEESAASLLLQRANAALELPDLADATLAAAAAVALDDTAEARGAALRLAAAPRVRRTLDIAVDGGGTNGMVSPAGLGVVVLAGGDAVLIDPDGREMARYEGAGHYARTTTRDGKLLVQPRDGLVRLTGTGARAVSLDLALDDREAGVYGAAWSGDDLYLCLDTPEVLRLDARTGAVRWRRASATTARGTLSLGAGGLAIGFTDGGVCILDPDDGSERWCADRAHPGGNALAWAAGRLWFGGVQEGGDGRLYATDTRSVTRAAEGAGAAWGLAGSVAPDSEETAPYVLAADGDRVWVGGADGTLAVRDAHTGAQLTRFRAADGTIRGLAVTSDRAAWTYARDGRLRRWELDAPPAAVPDAPRGAAAVSLAVAGDTAWLVEEGGVLRGRDPRSGQLREEIGTAAVPQALALVSGGGDAVAWTARGDVWRIADPPRLLVHLAEAPRAVILGGTDLFAAFRSGALRRLTAEGAVVPLADCASSTHPLAWSGTPGGTTALAAGCAATPGSGPRIEVRTFPEGSLKWSVPVASSPTVLAWSADGSMLFGGLEDGSIRRWTATGADAGSLVGGTDPAADMAVSADGRWTAAVDTGGRLSVFGPDGNLRARIAYGVVHPRRLAFAGDELLGRFSDGSIARWPLYVLDLDPGSLRARYEQDWGQAGDDVAATVEDGR